MAAHTRSVLQAHRDRDTRLCDGRDGSIAEGGFYSSLDADSDGAEGKFYVWTKDELREALADDSLFELFVAAYGVTASGNWEGKTVLQRALDDASLAARFRVDEAEIQNRLGRGAQTAAAGAEFQDPPATDDKVICAWNGLMLRAFAQAGRFLDDEDHEGLRIRDVATRNAGFLLAELAAGRRAAARVAKRHAQAGRSSSRTSRP